MIVDVTLFVPLPQRFSYFSAAPVAVGARVQVPFGRKGNLRVGVVRDCREGSAGKLKHVNAILDGQGLFDPALMKTLAWCASYYLVTDGEVMQAALPLKLREGERADAVSAEVWEARGTADEATGALGRAKKQLAVWEALSAMPTGAGIDVVKDNDWRTTLKALAERGLAERIERPLPHFSHGWATRAGEALAANTEQQAAINALVSCNGFGGFLLDGVTGSGKTEVYLQAIAETVAKGRQVLVLVPEISLTPQLVERFMRRFDGRIAVMHSGLNDSERAAHYREAAHEQAAIVIGTRSAVFVPMPALGLIVVDEEHDASLKQHDSRFGYNARNVAVMRAKLANVPVVLCSGTPSLDSLHNCERGAYTRLVLSRRAGDAAKPVLRLLDVRSDTVKGGLSEGAMMAIRDHLAAGNQVIVFINRRGWAPLLSCEDCGWTVMCTACDLPMTLHHRDGRLHCHRCGASRKMVSDCPKCFSRAMSTRGVGTEQLLAELQKRFPTTSMARLDSDSTSRKGALGQILGDMADGKTQLLVGTQIVAKGHHFAGVTLVVVVDADAALYSDDYRAGEQVAQLVLQVAGRAGREQKPGTVLIQTRCPDNPLLQAIESGDYHAIATLLLQERDRSLPPYVGMTTLIANSFKAAAAESVLTNIRHLLQVRGDGVAVSGVAPAPIHKRAGQHARQLMVTSANRHQLNRVLTAVMPEMTKVASAGGQVSVRFDVDPLACRTERDL